MAPAELKDQIPGISGTRALSDNLSDMKAQVASNFKGIGLVHALIEEYTLEVVQAYMHHIQVRRIGANCHDHFMSAMSARQVCPQFCPTKCL